MKKKICDCCEGITKLTPASTANRPGLDQLNYRVGTHAAFLETMKARLSTMMVEVPREHHPGEQEQTGDPVFPLLDLTTRAPGDPAIAFLDSWATIADVLTFYQERIANEGYLRTATERRSILELARLVGYGLLPGVSASVFLAYTIDEKTQEEVTILAGSRAKSIPGPGELSQSFETSEKLKARAEWNNLKPRMTRPQTTDTIKGCDLRISSANGNEQELIQQFKTEFASKKNVCAVLILVTTSNAPKCIIAGYNDKGVFETIQNEEITNNLLRELNITDNTDKIIELATSSLGREPRHGPRVYLQGVSTNIKANDPLLIKCGNFLPVLYRVLKVKPDAVADRTLIKLQKWNWTPPLVPPPATPPGQPSPPLNISIAGLTPKYIGSLIKRPSVPLLKLSLKLATAFTEKTDSSLQVLNGLLPDFKTLSSIALSNLTVPITDADKIEVYAPRVKAAPHGHTALNRVVTDDQGREVGREEWPLNRALTLGMRVDLDSGKNPISADLTYKYDNRTQTAVASFDDGTVSFNLNSLSVELKNNSGKFSIKFTGRLARTFTFTPKNTDTISVKIGVKTVTEIGLNQTLTVPFGKRSLRIVYKSLPEFRTLSAAVVAPTPLFELSVFEESPQSLSNNEKKVIALDAVYDEIIPDSWVAIVRDDGVQVIDKVLSTTTIGTTNYNHPSNVTELTLKEKQWLFNDVLLSDIRDTTVFAQSEKLDLAEEPIDEPVSDGASDENLIELDGLKTDLKSGHWLTVTGERTDITAGEIVVGGVQGAELVRLNEAKHDSDSSLPGDKNHTFLKLANPLKYSYKRDTVKIYGNIVKATHGETRNEVLGSGDGSKALQSFTLKQPPLTYVASPSPAGAASTLKVHVDEVQWHETDAFPGLGSTDRRFITRTNDEKKTTLIFGNGKKGARLPTGIENIKAEYRSGIGKPGNVKAAQISLLQDKPLGVKEVINPLRASGGANREGRDQARKNAPLAVMALDRLVSVQDYADFARTFAGIGKIVARRMSYEGRAIVHLTIAGADDVPIEQSSDLYQNLSKALCDHGDRDVPVRIQSRELLLLVISAKLCILPDYLWDSVESQVRVKLLDTFSFERRELGQDALLSEAISAIQSVKGVRYVDVDIFGGVPEKNKETGELLTPSKIADKIQAMADPSEDDQPQPAPRVPVHITDVNDERPAQLALLSPQATNTLILNEVK